VQTFLSNQTIRSITSKNKATKTNAKLKAMGDKKIAAIKKFSADVLKNSKRASVPKLAIKSVKKQSKRIQ